jgi:hypothetical protein
MTRRRVWGLLVGGVLAMSACAAESAAEDASVEEGAGADGSDTSDGPTPYETSAAVVTPTEQISPSPSEDVPSGLATFRDPIDELPPPTIDLSQLRSGGPPPDGIPAVDAPVFHDASTVDYLAPTDPVVAVEINGDARAYPLEIMIWHELVNDTVGGVPVSIAYCPLCNSVTVYDREIEGRVLDFGVSGLLFNSSLVMYDRQTQTLWSHFSGQPLYGELGEAELVERPSTIVGFETWRAAHPDGLVLTRDTGAQRSYGVNPYPGYDDIDNDPFLFEGDVDGRYTAMTRVVGVATPGDDASAVAFPLLDLRARGAVPATLDGDAIVALWIPGSTSALDLAGVSGGVDVGATGVFRSSVDGRRLTFTTVDGLITDEETGSTWNIFGEAIAGDLFGAELEQVPHIDTFWFAWIAFHPESDVVTP